MLWALGQPNNEAAQAGALAGMIVGRILAVVVCGGIPIAVGNARGQPSLGGIGGVLSGAAALILGCLIALPLAGVFVLIICLMTMPKRPRRRRLPRRPRRLGYDDGGRPKRPSRRLDEEEEEEEEPASRSKRRVEDDEDDVPRRRRRIDDEDDDHDRPRRRRRDDDD
jgi:hypothetical protein